MRISRPVVLLLAIGSLALAGCGGSDDDDPAAVATLPTTAAQPTGETAPAAPTESTPSTTTNEAPPVVTTQDTPSGGATPPSGTVTTPPPSEKPKAGGVRPLIKIREDGTARTVASDTSLAELWCDAARQGAYDDQLGEATTLTIAVRGSDHVETCDLLR